MPIQKISFTSPFDEEAQAIENRRRVAEYQQQQASQPIQSVSPNAPISWTQGLAKVLNAYNAKKSMREADAEAKALGERYRTTLADTLRRGRKAMTGTPGSSEQIVDELANGGEGQAATINAPAVAPDAGRASEVYMEHPATAGLGIQMAGQEAQNARTRALLAETLMKHGQPQAQAEPQRNPMIPGPGASVMAGSGSSVPTEEPQQPQQQLQQQLQQQQQAPQQRGIPGINPQALDLVMSGDPALSKVAGWLQENQKPLTVAEGGAVYIPGRGVQFVRPKVGEGMRPTGYGPNGELQGVEAIPGYTQAFAGIEGAREGARAGYDLVNVPLPGGGTQQMTRAQAARFYADGQQPRAPAGNFQATGGAPGGLGYTRPDSVRAGESKFNEKVGAEFGDIYAGLIRADLSAPQTIAKYDRLGSLLANVNTGKYKGTTASIKAAAKSLGFDLDALGVGDDLAPTQAALALSNQLALELRNPAGGAGMPGALSDKDREFLVQSVPGIENDPSAIPLMIDYRKKLAQREQQVAKRARAYKKRVGILDDGFFDELADWSERNPLFPQGGRPSQQGGGGDFRVLSVRPAR